MLGTVNRKLKLSVKNIMIFAVVPRYVCSSWQIYFPLNPMNQIKPNFGWKVLEWSPFNMMSDSTTLHLRCLLLPKIEISIIIYVLLNYMSKWVQILTAATWHWVVQHIFTFIFYKLQMSNWKPGERLQAPVVKLK